MHIPIIVSLLLSVPLAFASPAPVEVRTSCTTGISAAEKSRVQEAFSASGVVPTLIPKIDPAVTVNAAYNGKKVKLGNIFKTTETLLPPDFGFDAEPGHAPATTNYTYFLVDPDVPNPNAGPLRLNFLHWQVAHAHPACVTDQSPETVTIYEPLTPASNSQHRYSFLVYREPKDYVPDLVVSQVRPGFDLNAYTKKHGLKLVGGNFLREAITNGITS